MEIKFYSTRRRRLVFSDQGRVRSRIVLFVALPSINIREQTRIRSYLLHEGIQWMESTQLEWRVLLGGSRAHDKWLRIPTGPTGRKQNNNINMYRGYCQGSKMCVCVCAGEKDEKARLVPAHHNYYLTNSSNIIITMTIDRYMNTTIGEAIKILSFVKHNFEMFSFVRCFCILYFPLIRFKI